MRRMLPKLLLVLGVWFYASGALAQGLIEFSNWGPGSDAPVYDVDGRTPLAGPAFSAQLYAAAPGSSLQPVGVPVPFQSSNPGYFMGDVVAVLGVPQGGTAVVQVVAWRASDGLTFEAADHPGGHVGESSVITVRGLGGLLPPPSSADPATLFGLQSFSLHVVVPEPSVFAIGLLGGSLLALGRRRHWARGAVKLTPAPP